ncbi:MAG: 1-deoxy-D-xylulose-5-phosphate synthase [Rikenellaceae bacterium]
MEEKQTKYLDKVNSAEDLKKLEISQLKDYCQELRRFIIESVSGNPGHLGSSLGALELAVAIHYVYDTPSDSVVWDVGHQAYAHKIITGRRERFVTNRKKGGLSGFPKRSESEYDAFGVGHASTSISAALGMATASKLQNEDKKVVAIIGDGSMSGGLAFEALNNASQSDMLVILNDNNISIDPNVGALKDYLMKISTSRKYNRFKNHVWKVFSRTPKLQRFLQKVADSTKSFFMHQGDLFESFGFRYFGPVDGHNIELLVKRLEKLRDLPGAKLLHVLTVKGKGYAPAEKNQTEWHAPGIFDPTTGEKPKPTDKLRFQDIFGYTIVELAQANQRIVGITPAMPTGCSLGIMMEQMPDRAFDVGIAEGHAVTFAAGMAAKGLVPFCNIYSSFSQRSVDNIIHDVAIQSLEVIFCFDRAGLVGEDGSTHHGVFDIALLRSIPNVIISAPADALELRNMMYTASQGGYKAAFVIRYPRGGAFSATVLDQPLEKVEIGSSRLLNQGDESIGILSLGELASEATAAIEQLKQEKGMNITHYDLRFAKPLDHNMLEEIGKSLKTIITVENGVRDGGVGSAILEYYSQWENPPKVVRLGVPDHFVEQATAAQQKQECQIDSHSIKKEILKWINI